MTSPALSAYKLRTAVSRRRWEKTGELSTHYWIEVEPELWIEVDDLGTPEAQEQFRAEHPPIDRPIRGRSYVLRAHTSYLRQFSDTLTLLGEHWPESSNDAGAKR